MNSKLRPTNSACLALVLVGALRLGAQTFQWPVDSPTFSGNSYSTYNAVGNHMHHTGVDMTSSLYLASNYDTPVYACADGTVESIFRTADTTTACDGTSIASAATENHGFGNVVIIRHANGSFSLYGHLDCIWAGISAGVAVSRGQRIGTLGNSSYDLRRCGPAQDCSATMPGVQAGVNPHVHFEIKDRGVLGDQSNDNDYWGYTPDVPDGYGYHDPETYIAPIAKTIIAPTAIRVTTSVLNVRTGPGTGYSAITSLSSGQEFVASAVSGGWYRIDLPNTKAAISGWIASTSGGQTLAVEDTTATQLQVSGSGAVGQPILPAPGAGSSLARWDNLYGTCRTGEVWGGQRFVMTDSQPGWFKYDLPVNHLTDSSSCAAYDGFGPLGAWSSSSYLLPGLGITFDDLATTNASGNGPIPVGYGALEWKNFFVYRGVDGANSGYLPGTVSSPNVAYNGGGNPASISTRQTSFDLTSAYLTAAWRDNLQVEARGYRAGTMAYDTTYTLSATGPTLVNFNFTGVNEVDFTSSGGTAHPGYTYATYQFAMDNVNVRINRNPSPTAFEGNNLLMNPGFELGLAYWATDHATTRSSDPSPHSGTNYLIGSVDGSPTSLTYQTVDLAGYFTTEEIDRGAYAVAYGGFQSGWHTQTDNGLIAINLLDETNGVIRTEDLGWFYSNNTWVEKDGLTDLLRGTRRITYAFNAQRYDGYNNDGYLDDAFLKIIPKPSFTTYRYEPTSGNFTITWTSLPGATYAIKYAASLADQNAFVSGTNLLSNIPSGGVQTTATVNMPVGGTGFLRIFQQSPGNLAN